MMHKLAVCPLFQIPQSWCSHILYTSTMTPCKSNTHLSRRSCTSAVIVLSISCTLSTCSKALCQKIGYNKLIELSISNSWYLLLVLSFYTQAVMQWVTHLHYSLVTLGKSGRRLSLVEFHFLLHLVILPGVKWLEGQPKCKLKGMWHSI